jgi:hypothetical protein
MLVGSHLAPGAFGDLLTPLFDPQQASQQANPATSTVPGDFRNLQRRLATLREVQAVARVGISFSLLTTTANLLDLYNFTSQL